MVFGNWKTIVGLSFWILMLSACTDSTKIREGQEVIATESMMAESEIAGRSENMIYALVTKDENNTYMKKMEEGFKSACEEIGVDAVCYGPADYDSENQIELIRSLMEDGVSGIAVAANDADALHQVLREALDAGIYVISLDSAVNVEDRILHIQQAEPERVGRVLLQAAYSMIGGQGTVGLITTSGYATNQNVWMEWMKREMEEYPQRYKDLTLLEEKRGFDDYEKTVECTLELLEEYPELNMIITPSVVSMVAVGDTLKACHSDVLFTGLGLPSEMSDFIEIEKSCMWFYLWNPIELGYLSAYTLDALERGEISGKIGDRYAAGVLGSRSVKQSPDGGTEVVLGDPIKFDENNISLWKTVY